MRFGGGEAHPVSDADAGLVAAAALIHLLHVVVVTHADAE